MSKKLAYLISVAFHPLLMPTVVFFLIYHFTPFLLAPYNDIFFVGKIFVSSFVIPLVSILILYKANVVQNFSMEGRNERVIPFTFTALFYWMVVYMFSMQFKANTPLLIIIMCISTTITLVTLINFFWKISAHSAGLFGVMGFLSGINYKYPESQLMFPTIGILLISGATMSARLYLQTHSLAEVLTGALLGFLMSFAFVYFLF